MKASISRAVVDARAILDGFVSLVFPDACLVCGLPSREPLCGDCLGSFKLIEGPVCGCCGRPTLITVERCRECHGRRLAFVDAVAPGVYEGALKEAIHVFKYANGKRLAPQLAGLMAERVGPELLGFDAITFVPMTGLKIAKRGYNQAELLAIELAKFVSTNVEMTRLLKRVRTGKPQSDLAYRERLTNLRDAFIATGPVTGRVLLVDDVYTTGSTANECARALRRAGASRVRVATVARTVSE